MTAHGLECVCHRSRAMKMYPSASDSRGESPNPPRPVYRIEHCCENPAHGALRIVDTAGRILTVHNSADDARTMLKMLETEEVDAEKLTAGVSYSERQRA